jgi:hypothetical protein
LQHTKFEVHEDQILSDICAVKVLSILLGKNLLPDRASDVCISDFMPEPAIAILQRVKILDEAGSYCDDFVKLYEKRGNSLNARVEFTLKSTLDFINFGESLFQDVEEFMGQSQVFSSFDYSKGFGSSPIDRSDTKKWCQYVSSLTELEAPKLVEFLLDCRQNKSDYVLEFGGNVGTFAEEICRQLDIKKYSIIDIPLVCEIGREQVARGPFAKKIEFSEGNMFLVAQSEEEIKKYNTIIFKSVLHDWPIHQVDELLGHVLSALSAGSRLLIFERCAFLNGNIRQPSFQDVSNLIFSPFYRDPHVYMDIIKSRFQDFRMEVAYTWIDMKWFMLTVERG